MTVDPERDTVANLRDYISNFDPRIDALVPTMEQLPKVAASFRIYYAKVPTSDGGYTMDHTASVFLMERTESSPAPSPMAKPPSCGRRNCANF